MVELADGATADAALAERDLEPPRTYSSVTTAVELVPYGTLPRSEYKSRLVEHEEEG